MALKDTLEFIRDQYSDFKSKTRVDNTHPIYEKFCVALPNFFRERLSSEHLLIEGSVGKGNIAKIPWIAFLDLRVTSSPKNGHYLVYTFSSDMKTLYLSYALGVMKYEEKFGDTIKAQDHIFSEAVSQKERLRSLFEKTMSRKDDFNFTAPVDLKEDKNISLGRKYEKGIIFNYKYDLNSLPSDEVLLADLQDFVLFYEQVIEGNALLSTPAEQTTPPKAVSKPTKEFKPLAFPDHIVKARAFLKEQYNSDVSVHTRDFPRKGYDLSVGHGDDQHCYKVVTSPYHVKSFFMNDLEHEALNNMGERYGIVKIENTGKDSEVLEIVNHLKQKIDNNDIVCKSYTYKCEFKK